MVPLIGTATGAPADLTVVIFILQAGQIIVLTALACPENAIPEIINTLAASTVAIFFILGLPYLGSGWNAGLLYH